jgi:hypothetical protein
MGLFSHAVLSPEYLLRDGWLEAFLLRLCFRPFFFSSTGAVDCNLSGTGAADFNCSSTTLWSVVGLITLAGLGCVAVASEGVS